MIFVKKGVVISKDTVKSGKKQDGTPWLFGIISAESGYDKIQVWASNPEVGTGSDLEVDEIIQVKLQNRKYTDNDGNEKWAKDFTVQAKLSKIGSPVEGFAMISDDSIPF